MSDPRHVKTEEIVAFLDDELKGQARAAVEAQISLDPEVRAEAEQLKRTWDLLDFLPRAEASGSFTCRTLERIAPPAPATAPVADRSPRRPVIPAPGSVLVLALAAAGFALLGRELTRPEPATSELQRQLGTLSINEVRVIERLPLYRHIPNLKFLDELADSGWFEDLEPEPLPGGYGPGGLDYLAARLAEFRSLPEERQAELRELDRALFALPERRRVRLTHTMAAYAGWLNGLPQDRREELTDEPEAASRLREEEWIADLSASRRVELEAAPEVRRAELITRWRTDDIRWHAEWRWARKRWPELRYGRTPLPLHSAEFREELTEYVESRLRSRLAADELPELEDASELLLDGDFPGYVTAVAELIARHPELPGPGDGPRRFDQLPADTRSALLAAGLGPEIEEARLYEGAWPEYAAAVARTARRHGIRLAEPLGPARPDDFDEATRSFIRRLSDQLSKPETRQLRLAEGLWPEYPRLLTDLARKHGIPPPVPGPPGPPDGWNRIRKWR